ncbi:hypothetical protein V6N11_081490 [Hibiscus sabdariffa]|uniref:Gnk2-homologous domain-containing protein n=2 Tax=Hibiscus sabdariffa TaxID=183260 RepID=A0ABR2B900_9ROSI
MADTVSLCLITFIVLIKFIACQFPMLPTYRDHYCLGPENETATAAYQSSLVSLLDSMSVRASDHTFYNDSFDGVYSLFLCRGDLYSSNICQLCVGNATLLLRQSCPSDKRAIIWFEQCMLRYSDINFFGQVELVPYTLMWNSENSTSPDEGNIGTRGFMYSIVDRALYAPNMSASNQVDAVDGSGRRYGIAQCSRDLNVTACSSCLRYLLNRAENCCITRKGWRLLTPSCYINYTMNPFIDHPAPPSENEAGEGDNSTKRIIIIVVSSLGGVFVAVLAGFLYQRKKRHFKGLCAAYGPVQAWTVWHEGIGHELIDPNIADDCPASEVVRWIHIALLCVQDDPAVRPTMSLVILMLGSKSINLPQPSTPPYSAARFVSMSDQSSSIGTRTGFLPSESDQSITSTSSLLSKQVEITENRLQQ